MNKKMSKVQTKLNFVEKKKTSARLQETFKIKEKNKDSNSISKADCAFIYNSPKKLEPSKQTNLKCTSIKSCGSDEDLSSKENKISLINEICQKSPVVVLSPLKTNNGIRSCITDDKQSREEVRDVVNTVLHKTSPNESPIKKTERRNLENDSYKLRSSPLKRVALSPKCSGEESSPPKRECSKEETPSQLITKLALNSPERLQKHCSRKELFPNDKFDEACKALHSSAPDRLPGREDKLELIKDFLLKHSREETSGSLYISGPPGTGKTATVNVAITDPEVAEAYRTVCLNCTTLNSSGSIYNRIVSELKLKSLGHSEKASLTTIQKHLETTKRKMILIILDELDQLCTSKQSVLYSVFEWPTRPNSRLVLVGIANALDLTDRVLPRLQAKLSVQPTVVHFPSYSRQQIIDIIADRLQQAGAEEVFSGATLQLLAGKVAAVNGDVRRALDIARRVVEVAERRLVLQPLSDNGPVRQTVALQEVMSVVNDVYNTAQSLDSSQTSSFPLQQKLLICSLLLIRQTSKAKDVNIGKLHEVYKKVCGKRNMSALDISEFISLTSLVEARGILKINGKTYNRLSKVVLQWDEKEVKSALQDKNLLAEVLMDKGVAA